MVVDVDVAVAVAVAVTVAAAVWCSRTCHTHGVVETELRRNAKAEANARYACFERARMAYQRGDGEAARKWSQQGRRHERRWRVRAVGLVCGCGCGCGCGWGCVAHRSMWAQELNAIAKSKLMAARGSSAQAGGHGHSSTLTLDVHGLHVNEAKDAVRAAVSQCTSDGALRAAATRCCLHHDALSRCGIVWCVCRGTPRHGVSVRDHRHWAPLPQLQSQASPRRALVRREHTR